MHVLSSLLTGVGIAFLMLAGLLVHEARSDSDRTPAGALRALLQKVTSRTVLNFDRDMVFGAAVPVVLFLVLPGAALLNAVLGGSPFMLVCYILITASLFVHMLLAERPGAEVVTAACAGAGAVLVFVVLPYYAVWSLTSHMMTGAPAEGALAGMLIAILLYAANAGVWTLMHAAPDTAPDGLAHRFAGAALGGGPAGYVLFWFVVLGFNMAGASLETVRGWAALIAFTAGFALCFALFKEVLDAGARRQPGNYTPAWGSGGLGVLAMLAAFAIH